MGFNATVVVLLDNLDKIEKDPQFGKKLVDAIRYRSMIGNDKPGSAWDPKTTAPGQTSVVEVHHADSQIVVTIGGNCGRVLGVGGYYNATDDEIIKNLNKMRLERDKERKAKIYGR